MHRFVGVLTLCAICVSGTAFGSAGISDLYSDTPQKGTPQKLQEVWLRFHETGLCQEVDAAFVFDGSGMQVWSRIESEKSYLKFQQLFEPYRGSFRIELYTNRLREGKKPENENDPPPSLWQNYELRSNLGDRAAQALKNLDLEEQVQLGPFSADDLLKQRLLIYAEQTLIRNREMGHYALDLFALARMALDPDIPPDMKSKAIAICADHAKKLEKNIEKLAADLEQALPRSGKSRHESLQTAAPDIAGEGPLEKAEKICLRTQNIARRVYQFIYPEHFTVELDDLRNPSLLESLRTLQQMVMDFRKALGRPGWK
jgi:hypothetical protein